MTRLRLIAAAALAAAIVLALPPTAQAQLSGYHGKVPFHCKMQSVGTGVDFPRPNADPFCVRYKKTNQQVSDLSIVDFLANEPARVAAAVGKCFYFQRDHWEGHLIAGQQLTQTYRWRGAYFFDLARGWGGAFAQEFSVNNSTFDPTVLPFFPDEHRPYFGEGRGGVMIETEFPVEERCVRMAERRNVYRPWVSR